MLKIIRALSKKYPGIQRIRWNINDDIFHIYICSISDHQEIIEEFPSKICMNGKDYNIKISFHEQHFFEMHFFENV